MHKKITLVFLLFIYYVFQTTNALCQLVNDNAKGAIKIQVGAGCTGAIYTNIGATQGADEPLPNCSDDPTNPLYTNQHLVWFKFTSPASGAVRVSTDIPGGTLHDTQAALFSASDSSDYSTFQIIGCDDDNGAINDVASIFYVTGLTGGQTYYILIDGWLPQHSGTFCLTIDEINSTMLSTNNTCTSSYPPPWGGGIYAHYKGWVSLVDDLGRIVVNVRNTAGGYANAFTCGQNVNTGALRQLPSGRYYMDRNFFVYNRNTVAYTDIEIQLFFLNTEFNTLNAAAGGNVTLTDLYAIKQAGACTQNYVAATPGVELPHSGCPPEYQKLVGKTATVSWVTAITDMPPPGKSNFFLYPNVIPAKRDTICTGDTVTLRGSQIGTFTWDVVPGGSPVSTLSCSSCANPIAKPDRTTQYIQVFTSSIYCSDTSTVIVVPATGHVNIDTNICFSNSGQLNVPVNNSVPYTVRWSPGLYLNDSTIPNPVCTPTTDTLIRYIVTVKNNGSNNRCIVLDTIHVRHFNKLALRSPDTAICLGATVQIPLVGSTLLNYAWTPASGLNNASLRNPLATPNSTTTYKVVATYPTCRDSITYLINVSLPPNVTKVTPADPTACGMCDGSIALRGLVPYQAFDVTYNRNGAPQSLTLSSDNDSTLLLLNLCDGTYDNITIKSGVCTYVVPGSFILTDPVFKAGFKDTVHLGCNGDTVLFTNTSQYTGAVAYRWSFGDHTSDTATNPTHIYNQGTYAVTLFMTNGHCNDSVTVSLPLLHPIEAGFTIDDDTVCQGQLVTFTNTSTGIDPMYMWSFGDGATDMMDNTTHVYDYTGIYHVTLIETDFLNCIDTADALVYVDSISDIAFSISDSVVCQGQAVRFTGNYMSLNSTGTEWDFGDGYTSYNTSAILHAFEKTGRFNVKFTAGYRACPDTSAVKVVNVYPFPLVNIGRDTAVCPGMAPVTITNLAPRDGVSSYLWNTGATNDNISVSIPGLYWLEAIAENGCSSTDSVLVRPNCYVAIPNAFTPNGDGVNDYFFPRQLLADGVTLFHMQVMNRWGQIVFETDNTIGKGWDGTLNGNPQPDGVYVYLIEVSFMNNTSEKYKGNVTLLH